MKAGTKTSVCLDAIKLLLVYTLTITATGGAMAADYTQNPFSLAYDNAITKNIPGAVNIHPVTYKLDGIEISANVYTPSGYDSNKKYPAIVVAHPNGGVKEQVAGLYAQRLAEQGYITITAEFLSHNQEKFLGIIMELLTQISLIIQVEFIQLFQEQKRLATNKLRHIQD